MMGTKITLTPEGFEALSSDDRIEYVQSLWDFIAQTPDQAPVPEFHKQVLNQRLAEYEYGPNFAESWDKVRNGILITLRSIR